MVVSRRPSSVPGKREVFCDLRHLPCPTSLLSLKQTLRQTPPGTVVSVLCADPLVALDMEILAQRMGYQVVRSPDTPDFLQILVPGEDDGASRDSLNR